MTVIGIRHRTSYRYREPVSLGPHRLMLRPREGRDIRLIGFDLDITPAARLTWGQDVYGNSVAMATFSAMTDHLTVESIAQVRIDAAQWPVFDIAASAISYPFRYSDNDWAELGVLAAPHHADPAGSLGDWARRVVRGNPTDTLSLLKDLSAGVAAGTAYQTRDEEGTQPPLQTLQRGIGSCRDFALLFVEAARTLGFGARLISGYIHNPDGDPADAAGSGTTHAWAEIYLPGAGWIAFDPTNRGFGGHNLVPVAVARDMAQAAPVVGSYVGDGQAFEGMTIAVSVTGNPWPARPLTRIV